MTLEAAAGKNAASHDDAASRLAEELVAFRAPTGPRVASMTGMHVEAFRFGSIRIDGCTYEHDVVIERGSVRKRRKKPSKRFKGRYGHTPLSLEERIPWDCKTLIIGTGANGQLPVMDEVTAEADLRGVELVMLPTPRAIARLHEAGKRTNAVLHVTC